MGTVTNLRNPLMAFALREARCPVCGGVYGCTPQCRYQHDNPAGWRRRQRARKALWEYRELNMQGEQTVQ